MRTITMIGSDQTGTDKGSGHRYWEIYDLLFARHRLSARTVLEIGVYRGASIDVWLEAFPNAEIHAVELSSIPSRATIHVGNAYSTAMLRELPDQFDVIVDDGPHTFESMLYVAEHYAGRLAEGGTLVIEDIQDRAWIPRIVERLPEHLQAHTFIVDRTTVPQVKPDSILFVVEAWT